MRESLDRWSQLRAERYDQVRARAKAWAEVAPKLIAKLKAGLEPEKPTEGWPVRVTHQAGDGAPVSVVVQETKIPAGGAWVSPAYLAFYPTGVGVIGAVLHTGKLVSRQGREDEILDEGVTKTLGEFEPAELGDEALVERLVGEFFSFLSRHDFADPVFAGERLRMTNADRGVIPLSRVLGFSD